MADPAGGNLPLAEPARAKINLFLHVTGRRADGYHLLDSMVGFSDAADTITLADAPSGGSQLSLALGGPFAGSLSADPDNLVLKAARALADKAGLPAHAALSLHKALPVASGIGGGSADAAATLRLLSRAWGLDPARIDLPALALSLGADVPVCLATRATRMGGIGEILSPAPPLPQAGLLLVNPGVHVATPAVFRARSGPFSAPASLRGGWQTAADLAADLDAARNDLEPAAIALCPAIADVLSALRGLGRCRLARMSGSGATCFALFDTPDDARHAATSLHRPEWWTHAGRLLG